jgi:protein-S-isoprenylcysteine O-methyltransferase Ste14
MFRLGFVVVAGGVLFAGWGILTFRRRSTAIIPFHPATTIVMTGPYRLTRNPMYIGMSVQYSGVALLLDTWWAFALLPVVVAIIDRQVIAREERYLSSAFGAEYDSYRSRVRRWI